jgi:hypothetical protein
MKPVNLMQSSVKVGDEFHYLRFVHMIGEDRLEYAHFKIEKINKITCSVKFITEIGAVNYHLIPIADMNREKGYYLTLEDAIADIQEIPLKHAEQWTKSLDWYTPQHPDYEFFYLRIQIMKDYAELLKKYSTEEHQKILDKHTEEYKKLKRGRFAL